MGSGTASHEHCFEDGLAGGSSPAKGEERGICSPKEEGRHRSRAEKGTSPAGCSLHTAVPSP